MKLSVQTAGANRKFFDSHTNEPKAMSMAVGVANRTGMRERRPSVNRVHESRNATKQVFLCQKGRIQLAETSQ